MLTQSAISASVNIYLLVKERIIGNSRLGQPFALHALEVVSDRSLEVEDWYCIDNARYFGIAAELARNATLDAYLDRSIDAASALIK